MQQPHHPTASSSQSLSTSSSSSFPIIPSRSLSNASSSASSNGASNRSTTSTPVSSQPRPASSTALARGADSSFDFLFLGGGVTPSAQAPPQIDQKSVETGSDASKLDKGKGVARNEEEAGANERDAMERQIQVDKILKRAEAGKLARAFRNRLALASFKTSRGLEDVTMDVIEPHLRDEALKRSSKSPHEGSQHSNESSPFPPAPPSRPASASQAVLPKPAPSKPPPIPAPISAPSPSAVQQPYQYQINYNPRPLDMDAVIGGSGGNGLGGSAHKRNRSINDHAGSPYGSQGSPYSTANVYRAAKTQDSPTKRRNTDGTGTTPRQRQKSAAGGGSKRGTPLRQSANGSSPAKPPLPSDPAFSSFVDAAAALTGMARHPSDPSVSGSEEEAQGHRAQMHDPLYSSQGRSQQTRLSASLPNVVHSIPHPPHHHHAFPQPQAHVHSHPFPPTNGHPSGNYLYESLPLPPASSSSSSAPPAAALPLRPATPEKGRPNGGGIASGENSEVAAADLMLFLAHSPSPVQIRKPQPTLGDGSGVKGRRLFGAGDEGENDDSVGSGNGLAQSVFGGGGGGGSSGFSPSHAPALSHSTSNSSPFITSSSGPSVSNSRALDTPFDPSSSTSSGPHSTNAEPSKPSSQQFLSSSLTSAAPLGLDPTASSDPHLAFAAPGTPRQRQPSFNGQGWESFINASPSPARATIPRGDTPPGLGGNVGVAAELGEAAIV
ncbi:uncharacterized protein JCM6883_000941 [Sporobolomyces salmoneus]|uniref:uncharacterized protein n=1 Tax=Sporobolomyces salmoneus TaxID=183962 RepID=UPI0031703073